MTASYDVVTSALTGHASAVTGLADQLRTASDAVGQVNMANEAYGQTCQPFVTMLNTLATAGQDTLSAAVEALESTATSLRTVAGAYDQRETDSAGQFSGLDATLNSPGLA
jgi:hypothetical protein